MKCFFGDFEHFSFFLANDFSFFGATTFSITTFWIMTLSVTLKHDLSIKTLFMSVVGLSLVA
jgi:hypothetical protein